MPKLKKNTRANNAKTMREAKAHIIANHRALEAHLSRELRRFMKAFTDGLLLHAEVSLADTYMANERKHLRGVVGNFPERTGTGGGSTARESADLEFS